MNEIIVGILILWGTLFICISAIGVIRFSTLFTRIHAITKASSFGMLILLIGVCLFFGTFTVILKSIIIIIFIYLTAPLSAHAIAKSFRDREKEKEKKE